MKLLREVLLASALCLLLAPAANAVEASSQTQVGDLVSKMTIDLKNNKAGQTTAFRIHGSHELVTGAKPPQALSLDLKTAKGTSVNPSIVGTCDFSELKTTGSCPSSSRVGKGSAKARLDTGGIGTLDITDVKAYKIANSNCDPGSKLCAAVHASEPTTGVVADIVVSIIGSPPRVLVHDFALPTVLGIVPVNIETEVNIDKSKTVKVKGKKKKLFLLNNPKECPGTWDIVETRNFEGVGPVTNTVKIPCKK